MKNNKGFTLVELIAVIAILALIIILVMASTNNIQDAMRVNMFCTKIKSIENVAVSWGQDNFQILQEVKSGENHNHVTTATSKIKVQRLLNERYLKPDVENELIDPRNNGIPMNELEIIVYVKHNRVYAKIPSADDVCL